ncbi:MAG TPA: hypothetical protein PK076_11640 [Saprospiraceae bacterium]|nr:hypothetical protein [Saprospiraceae bacterium]
MSLTATTHTITHAPGNTSHFREASDYHAFYYLELIILAIFKSKEVRLTKINRSELLNNKLIKC